MHGLQIMAQAESPAIPVEFYPALPQRHIKE